jgi:hypothetical protein
MTLKRVYESKNIVMIYQGSLKDFAEVAMSPRILAICLEIAYEEAMPYAIAIAPRDDGTYVRSFKVQPTTVVLRGMRRVCARFINTAPHAALVEFGGRPAGGSYSNGKYKQRYRPPLRVMHRVRERITGRDGLTDPDLMG